MGKYLNIGLQIKVGGTLYENRIYIYNILAYKWENRILVNQQIIGRIRTRSMPPSPGQQVNLKVIYKFIDTFRAICTLIPSTRL